jgi:hypothetical protein
MPVPTTRVVYHPPKASFVVQYLSELMAISEELGEVLAQ